MRFQVGTMFEAEDPDAAIEIIESWRLSPGATIAAIMAIPEPTQFSGVPCEVGEDGSVSGIGVADPSVPFAGPGMAAPPPSNGPGR
jgi:hypothetical protein